MYIYRKTKEKITRDEHFNHKTGSDQEYLHRTDISLSQVSPQTEAQAQPHR